MTMSRFAPDEDGAQSFRCDPRLPELLGARLWLHFDAQLLPEAA
jgi:hypothetical protein